MGKKARKILDIFYPPFFPCIICGSESTDLDTGLCQMCQRNLPYIKNPCPSCGHELGDNNACFECTRPREFDKAVIALEYTQQVRGLVLSLKFNNKRYLARPMGRIMAGVLAKQLSAEIDYIIPVPLGKKRFKERGFNQSLLLAKEVSRILGLPLLENVLVQVKDKPDQSLLTQKERQANTQDVYACENAGLIKEKALLLVDDVLTTGYTAEACAKILNAAGAENVYVLAFAGSSLK